MDGDHQNQNLKSSAQLSSGTSQLAMEGDQNSSVSKNKSAYGSSMITTLNDSLDHLSKWIAAAVVGAVMVWSGDGRGLWGGVGALANWGISVGLKMMINQPRPFPARKSDPGMPSSHSQTLFYAFSFLALSTFECVGMNQLSFSFTVLTIYFCSHLSWLRVSRKYHTQKQVGVGAVLGSLFCVAWLRTWALLVSNAFLSYLWFRLLLTLGAIAFWMVLFSITASTFRCTTSKC